MFTGSEEALLVFPYMEAVVELMKAFTARMKPKRQIGARVFGSRILYLCSVSKIENKTLLS